MNMLSATDLAVAREVRDYLRDAITLEDFRAFFGPVAWTLGSEPRDSHPLTRRVELLLAEYGHDHRTEDDLRDALRGLMRWYA